MMRMGKLGLVLCLSLAACGAENNTGGTGNTDAGNTPTDTGNTTDRGQTVADAGPRDAGPRDTGNTSQGNYGECGRTVTEALCTCGNNQQCQQNALNASSQGCQTCLGMAQANCCPTQYQSFQTCAQTNMCQDLACAMRMCSTELNAFQTCLNTAVMSEAMMGGGRCTNLQVPCLGDIVTMGTAACP